MLTIKQPPTYGYKSVHDLPTPPSTSRPSPPLIYQEFSHKALSVSRSHSPPNPPMSAPHRGLPPPAAMTLPPQQTPTAGAPPPAHHAPPPPPPPPPSIGQGQSQSQSQSQAQTHTHQQRDSWGQLPAPPQQWQGAEESMRNWLHARAEEDKRRQEEEKTRQESLRLEQRKIEMDMLRASLSGGIPPPMVPLVFAGMGSGGVLPHAALEWAQQFMPPSQGQHPQLMPPQGPVSPEHQRDAHATQYHSVPPPAPAPAPGPPPAYAYPGSPTRPRGQTVTGTLGRSMTTSNLPNLNTQPAHGHGHGHGHGPAMMVQHPHMHPAQSTQHESQPSPSIYFHHWQPPTSQAGGGSSSSGNRPGTPSGETPRKRKATGQQHPAPAPAHGEARFRSPPPFFQNSLANPPFRGRRSHARQRSDLSSYRSSDSGRDRRDSFAGSHRGTSPTQTATPGPQLASDKAHLERRESQRHSVSSMLSGEPGPASASASQPAASVRLGDESEARRGPTSPMETNVRGGAGGSTGSREGEGEGEGM